MVSVVLTCILYSVFSFSTMSFGVTVVKVRGKCRAIKNIIYGNFYCTVCCTVYISSMNLGHSPLWRDWTTWSHRGVTGNSQKNQTEEEEGRTERQLGCTSPWIWLSVNDRTVHKSFSQCRSHQTRLFKRASSYGKSRHTWHQRSLSPIFL